MGESKVYPLRELAAIFDQRGISPMYWPIFTLTINDWQKTVNKYSWERQPEFLGAEMYRSKSGIMLMPPILLAQKLSDQGVRGPVWNLDYSSMRPHGKPPLDQVVIIGNQTGYEALNVALLLKDSEWGRKDDIRRGRIDIISAYAARVHNGFRKSGLDGLVKPRGHDRTKLVNVYADLEAARDNSPAFGSYDGIIAFEPLGDLERELRR